MLLASICFSHIHFFLHHFEFAPFRLRIKSAIFMYTPKYVHAPTVIMYFGHISPTPVLRTTDAVVSENKPFK